MALETLEFKDEDESVGPFRRRLFSSSVWLHFAF